MITIAKKVSELIARSPLFLESLHEDIANHSKIARSLKPLIERELHEEVSEAAIVMAIKRLPKNKLIAHTGYPYLKQVRNMNVRSNLVEFCFLNSPEIYKIYEKMLRVVNAEKQPYFNLAQGLLESIVIVNEEISEKIAAILQNEKKLRRIDTLSAITIRLPEESVFEVGVYYPILKTLAWEEISFVEIISTATEVSICFEQSVVDRAFSVIKRLCS